MTVTPPRDDPAWYTPAGIPEQLLAHAGSVRGGLDVGTAGKVGLLELSLAPSAGVTRVARQYQRAPLHVYRPIHLDAGRPDMAFVFLQQSGDGLVQGDRYRIDIDCTPNSAAHVTTQAATKVYTAPQNFATQLVNLHAGAGAVLEYLPDPVVPFRGSRLFQRTSLVVGAGAIAILGETLLPGRTAHGEAHDYDLYWAETEARAEDGRLLFADVLRFGPSAGFAPSSTGLLGTYEVVATLYVLAEQPGPADLVALLRQAVADVPDVLVGVSELPNACGVAVRVLGYMSRTVQHAVRATWNAARLALIGVPAPDLRKG